MLRYIPIAKMTEAERQPILRAIERDYVGFERLRTEHAEAMRNRQWERAQEIGQRMGEYMEPSDPAIRIVGGRGGYVLVDESRFGSI